MIGANVVATQVLPELKPPYDIHPVISALWYTQLVSANSPDCEILNDMVDYPADYRNLQGLLVPPYGYDPVFNPVFIADTVGVDLRGVISELAAGLYGRVLGGSFSAGPHEFIIGASTATWYGYAGESHYDSWRIRATLISDGVSPLSTVVGVVGVWLEPWGAVERRDESGVLIFPANTARIGFYNYEIYFQWEGVIEPARAPLFGEFVTDFTSIWLAEYIPTCYTPPIPPEINFTLGFQRYGDSPAAYDIVDTGAPEFKDTNSTPLQTLCNFTFPLTRFIK